ncbi:hypothetical protein CEXT_386551 [Caerostris extrusa]|uniref:Uncharacterized protein n=1 Tax=Caerostris extrusa TaxID=172846 RepID=A0AAV4Y733_CAEEX|nr:hypothetical protein CEXT_386551 [Caerostris extrusa]
MGLCMSRCYSEVTRMSCWKLNTGIEDRDRLIDFDMFLDEQPAPRPLSLLSLENELISSDVSLLHESDSEDSDVLYELGVDNEHLELQEEIVAAEASKEADKIKSRLLKNLQN